MWGILLLVILGLAHVPWAVEGANCSNRIIPTDLTARAGTITSPNFPHKFETPYCQRWVVDAGQVDETAPNYIHIYYTQPYFNHMTPPYFNVHFHEVYPFDTDQIIRHPTKDNRITKNRERIKRWATGLDVQEKQKELDPDHPHNLQKPLTMESSPKPSVRYMSIDVRIPSLYNTHFRAPDGFLHVYGFNLTYEINNSSISRRDTCSIYNCSAAGNCFATHDYKNFFCGCHEGRSGQYCEYSPICNPKKNINPCLNGGHCRSMASGSVICTCKPGYIGTDCSRRNVTSVKSCPGPDCPHNCDKSGAISSRRPCSCHNGTTRSHHQEGWVRHEVEFWTNWTKSTKRPGWNMKSDPNSLTEEDLRLKVGIELRLTTRLRELVFALDRMDSVTVMFFGPNSFQFRFYGPPHAFNETEHALHEITKNEVHPDVQIKQIFRFRQIPALLLEDVSVRPVGVIREHENYSITCSATGSSNTTFKWFKDDSPIDASLSLWGRITEMNWRREATFKSTSTLNFDKAHVNDRGTFTCQVSDEDEEQCKDFEMDILSKPNINLNKLSLTLIKNDSDTVITCSATLDDSVDRHWSYDWKINGELIGPKHTNEVKEVLFPQGSLLRIISAQHSKTYSCIVSNSAGDDSRDVRVEVLESVNSPSCPRQVDGRSRLSWQMTAPNQLAKRLCPNGYVGFVQRICHPSYINPTWGEPDFSKCVSRKLKAIEKSVVNAKLGYTNRSHLPELPKMLSVYLRDKEFLYLGEGERIIPILNDIGTYALEKGNTSDTKFFELFLTTTTTFLAFPESCVNEGTMVSLANTLYKMGINYTSASRYSFHSNSLVIEGPQMSSNSSLVFSSENKRYAKWLDFRLEIPNHERSEAKFVVVALRNLSFSVTSREIIISGTSFELITPVVYINSRRYEFFGAKKMILRFGIPSEWVNKILSKRADVACGSLDNNPRQSMSWKPFACDVAFVRRKVECRCDRFGQYGVLAYSIAHEEIVQPLILHWAVLFGSIVCIISCSLALVSILMYSHCQIITNSIYLLKIVVCFSLIISVLFILSMRAARSSIPLTTSLCTFLILSLSCHLTKSFKVFLTSSRLDLEWLRSVPLGNLLLGITFACVLPLWTSAAAMLHSAPNESALDERSPLFGTFVGTIAIILTIFLTIYYKATIQLRADRRLVDSDKIYILDYRMKTLNRAFAITLSTMMMTLAAILQNNAWTVTAYQYFFGFSTMITGMVVFFSYTIKSEYPIPSFITHYIVCAPGFMDPEKPTYDKTMKEKNKSPEKRYGVDRQVVSLLSNHTSGSRNWSEPETTMETLGGSSISSVQKQNRASSSVSSMKRPSFSSSHNSNSNHIQRSFTNPPNLMNHFLPPYGRPFPQQRWLASTTSSIGGSSLVDRPERVKCYLSDDVTIIQIPPPNPCNSSNSSNSSVAKIPTKCDAGEYVKPSLRPEAHPSNFTSKHSNFHHRKPRRTVQVDVQPPLVNHVNPSSHFEESLQERGDFEEQNKNNKNPFLKTEDINPHTKHAPLLNGCAHGGAGVSNDDGVNLVESVSLKLGLDLDHLNPKLRDNHVVE